MDFLLREGSTKWLRNCVLDWRLEPKEAFGLGEKSEILHQPQVLSLSVAASAEIHCRQVDLTIHEAL